MSRDGGWYDEPEDRLVRPYVITSGRTPADGAQLDLSTQVMVLRSTQELVGLGPEHLAVMRLSRRPTSIAEIAAHVKLPLGVVRVLCGDLIEWGLVRTRSPFDHSADRPSLETLEEVYDALQRL